MLKEVVLSDVGGAHRYCGEVALNVGQGGVVDGGGCCYCCCWLSNLTKKEKVGRLLLLVDAQPLFTKILVIEGYQRFDMFDVDNIGKLRIDNYVGYSVEMGEIRIGKKY